jgi:hypothetical protein
MEINWSDQIPNARQLLDTPYSVITYTDHRWTLPVFFSALDQKAMSSLPLVVFDQHYDICEPSLSSLEQIRRIRKAGTDIGSIVDLCKNHLSPMNDDWIIAGMELGIIGDAVLVYSQGSEDPPLSHLDHMGNTHKIRRLPGLSEAFTHQGALCDTMQDDRFSELWSILRWECRDGRFSRTRTPRSLFLDFDLDCFVSNWHGKVFPLPEEILRQEMEYESDRPSTSGWTPKMLVKTFLEDAAVVTLAQEPNWCGGQQNADHILLMINRVLFDGALQC